MADKPLKSLRFPGLDDTYTIPAIDNTFSVPDAAAGAAAVGAALAGKASNDAVYDVYPEDVASGAVASFPDGAEGLPVKDLTVAINAVQEGSGDPAPDNVRPITGWTGANIVVSPTENAQDGTTYTVDWTDEAGTVYGGTLDVTTGVLTVDRLGQVFNGTEGWSTLGSDDSTLFVLIRSDIMASNSDSQRGLCSHFRTTPVVTTNTAIGYYPYHSTNQSNTRFHIRPDLTQIPSVANWKSFLAAQYANDTPVTCVWYIEVPITYQLTPTEVKTLLGVNNIWADTGDVDVTYRADTKKYIDKKLAELAAQIVDA